MKLNREHWRIENSLRHRRDVTFREDASRIRKGSAGQVMAVLRNLAIYLQKRSGKKSLPAAVRHFVCTPMKTLEVLSSRV